MLFFKKKKPQEKKRAGWEISQKCLDLIIESSKSIYPKEFGGFLLVSLIGRCRGNDRRINY